MIEILYPFSLAFAVVVGTCIMYTNTFASLTPNPDEGYDVVISKMFYIIGFALLSAVVFHLCIIALFFAYMCVLLFISRVS